MDITDKFQEEVKKFTKQLKARDFKILSEKEINNGVQFKVFGDKQNGIVSVYYGKKGVNFVVQGASKEFKALLEALIAGEPLSEKKDEVKSIKKNRPHGFEKVAGFDGKWIGIDESGKGDFFGPLVTAAVMLDTTTAARLEKLGVKDSKKISDKKNSVLADLIRQICQERYSEIKFCPEEYNKIYSSFSAEGKNLNDLLGYAHAQTLEILLEKAPCKFALADKFGSEHFTQNQLLEKGRKILLLQLPRGEQNIAVAAASVLARDVFLREMGKMSSQFNLSFPKGAVDVLTTAKIFIQKYGTMSLPLVCKTHFRTYQQI